MPADRAIWPASRPITSSTITLSWLAAVGCRWSRASVAAATAEERETIFPGAPDFVVEIRSRTYNLTPLQRKMQLWMDGGARLGEAEAVVIETPGHTTGHISYWFEEDRALFCADTLFALGCGRVFEGTMEQMWSSLAKLRALPDDAIVHCGHEYTLSNAHFAVTVDPDNDELMERVARIEELRSQGKPTVPSNLGTEKRTNPFLRPDDPGIRALLGMADATNAEVFGEIRTRKDRG